MKAFAVVVLLIGAAMCAPQQAKENQVKAESKQVRQVSFSADPFYPQFGAKVAPGAQVVYLQGAYQQQPQYYNPGKQISYVSSAPAQAYYAGAPYTAGAYYTGAQPAGAYFAGAQPAGAYFAGAQPVFKKTVKPEVYKAAPQPVFEFKPAPAPVVKVHAPVPVPAPAPIVKYASPAAPAAEPFHVIVKQSQDDNFDGSFAYNYETDHGIAVQTSGFLKNAGTEDEIQVIQGSYTYYSPEGIPITTTYIADENGFQVQGDHLPQPPALPEAIAKSLEYQRSLPPSAEDLQEAAKQ